MPENTTPYGRNSGRNPVFTSDQRQRVGFPLYPGVTLLDFAGATQVFAFSGIYQAVWLASSREPIHTSEGVQVLPHASFAEAPSLDILFVPGGSAGDAESGVIWAMNDPGYQAYIKHAAAQAEWYGSVCVGAFILAAAGLLAGHTVTTYWSQLRNLALFPALQVDLQNYPRYWPDPVQTPFSGGGVSSSIDLALDILRQRNGEEVAQLAQLSIQYAPNPPLQAGDPSQAPQAIVDHLLAQQESTFIQPIRQAVLDLLQAQA